MRFLEKAYYLAEKAHSGQYRRDGRTPYIEHPKAVSRFLESKGDNDTILATALLHDVLEDTGVTVEDLRAAGMGDTVIEAVQVLTKPSDGVVNYDEYMRNVRQNKIAARVKFADILDNLGGEPTQKQILKYAAGLTILAQ